MCACARARVCVSARVFFSLLLLYNHGLSVLAETDLESEEERAVIDGQASLAE